MVRCRREWVVGLALAAVVVSGASVHSAETNAAAAATPGWTIEWSDLEVVGSPFRQETELVGWEGGMELLKRQPGVVPALQGASGTQMDLSIRGSSFSGAGLSLFGLSLAQAQTEHFNAELPLPVAFFAPASVLSGFDQVRRTEGHLVGTVSMTPGTARPTRRVALGVGERGEWRGSALVQDVFATDETTHALALSVSGHEAPDMDSQNNGLELWQAAGRWQAAVPRGRLDLMAGWQEKTFGARGYYGVTPAWDAEESIEDQLIAATWQADRDWRLSAGLRRLTDDYELFWTLPGTYRNEHRTDWMSVAGDGRVELCDALALVWRASGTGDRIRSDNLGDDERERAAVALLPEGRWGALGVSAGVRYEQLEDDSYWLPQARVEWDVRERTVVFANHSETVRSPSYTELNYNSPGSLGNEGLDNQTSRATEAGLGIKGIELWGLRASAFRRESRDTVDWIRRAAESRRWEAETIGTVETLGVEARGDLMPRPDLSLWGSYTWLDKDNDADLYASRYALDYAEHLAGLGLVWQCTAQVRLETVQHFRLQAPNALRTEGDTQVAGDMSLHVTPRQLPSVTLSLSLSNMWDDDYRMFPGQDTYTPRRVMASLSTTW